MASRGGGIGGVATAIGIDPLDPWDGINCDNDGGRDGDEILDGVRRGQLGRKGPERDPGRNPVPALLLGARRIRSADRLPAVADKDTHTGFLQTLIVLLRQLWVDSSNFNFHLKRQVVI